MPEHRITNLAALGDTSVLLHRTALAQTPAVLGTSTTSSELKVVMTSPSLKKYAQYFADWPLRDGPEKPSVPLRTVNSWKNFVKALEEFAVIDKLYMFFHGTPGSMVAGGDIKRLDAVAKLLASVQLKVRNEILIESCNVAENPAPLVPFAEALRAPKISAWNHYHVFDEVPPLTVPQGTPREDLEAVLLPYNSYLVPRSPTVDQILAKPGKWRLVVEWFRQDDNNAKLPTDPDDLESRTKIFRPRSEAKRRTIKSDEVEALREEYASSASRNLERVTITLPTP
ncbi:MAG TPA: hypothetical protein VNM90_06315 [Haliangium sp.]|nr:hypothetical protein [Haliangium sp.]